MKSVSFPSPTGIEFHLTTQREALFIGFVDFLNSTVVSSVVFITGHLPYNGHLPLSGNLSDV